MEAINMQKLNHPNLTKLIDAGRTEYHTTDKAGNKIESYEIDFIALQICSGGELFNFVANSGEFTEKTARFYMK